MSGSTLAFQSLVPTHLSYWFHCIYWEIQCCLLLTEYSRTLIGQTASMQTKENYNKSGVWFHQEFLVNAYTEGHGEIRARLRWPCLRCWVYALIEDASSDLIHSQPLCDKRRIRMSEHLPTNEQRLKLNTWWWCTWIERLQALPYVIPCNFTGVDNRI